MTETVVATIARALEDQAAVNHAVLEAINELARQLADVQASLAAVLRDDGHSVKA